MVFAKCEKARLREDSVTPNQQERLELESPRDPWMMNRNFIYKSRIAGRKKIFISGAAPSRTIFSDEKPRNLVHLSLSDCTDEFSIRQTFSQARVEGR